MTNENDQIIRTEIKAMWAFLRDSGWFSHEFFTRERTSSMHPSQRVSRIQQTLGAARSAQEDLEKMSRLLSSRVIDRVLEIENRIRETDCFNELLEILERLLTAVDEFKNEPRFASFYGDLFSVYLLILFRSSIPGQNSPFIRLMLQNLIRRKAIEIDRGMERILFSRIQNRLTVALITKRYDMFVLIVRGLKILFRGAIDFRTHGTAPLRLAELVAGLLVKHGIKLSEVTDIVTAGGDLGAIPDGIYVLTERLRDESFIRLQHCSLNRSALVAWELMRLLQKQGDNTVVAASLCSPLSFTTLTPNDTSSFFATSQAGLRESLQGYVKITPLKSLAAVISEIQNSGTEDLNLLVMSLDELFASVARKIGPRIVRKIAAQRSNRELISVDFSRIAESLEKGGFVIPRHFSLATREMGTGVREICELLMIAESNEVSPTLSQQLMGVVDSYADRIAMDLNMASSGIEEERPHYVAIASMMAFDRHFQSLFRKIRQRMGNPFVPVLCTDTLEQEFLTAKHLFEMYMNPAEADERLDYVREASSIEHALQVLAHHGTEEETFSFSSLMESVTTAIAEGNMLPGNLVLVGADNEAALRAVSKAVQYGLLRRVALIGDPQDIMREMQRTDIPLDPYQDNRVEIIPIEPQAVDFQIKKKSIIEVLCRFLSQNSDFFIMKGSVDTASLLQQALSIYSVPPVPSKLGWLPKRRMASHTALHVLPDGRFFAVSDAAVNPGFRNADELMTVIENQVEVVRKVVSAKTTLKVAIVTAVEKETSAIPATHLAAETARRSGDLEKRYAPMIVEGPLSFDLATVPSVAKEKHYTGRILGDANCLVGTDINTANVLYKMLSRTMGSLGLLVDNCAIITAGPDSIPIVLTSRGDTAKTKLNSILLALAYSRRIQVCRKCVPIRA
ncbi:MAG: phosphate acyltransferase [Desulfomonilaceae bacterium]